MSRSLDERFSADVGEYRLEVRGLSKTIRALEKSGADMSDMRDLIHKVGNVVVDAAKPLAPVKSGALRGTIRAGRGKTKAVIRAGVARVPYAAVQEYGWPGHGIEASSYVRGGLQKSQGKALDTLLEGLGNIIEKNGLETEGF